MAQSAQQDNSQHRLISTNPAQNYDVLGDVVVSDAAEIKEKVELCKNAQKSWFNLGLHTRIEHLRDLYQKFDKNKEKLARIQTQEMGRPIDSSLELIEMFLENMHWDIENAEKYLSNEILYEDEHEINELVYEPYGVVACIAAWNYPFGNFVASLSQALIAGNTAVMKYSEEVPLFSQAMEDVVNSSSLPKNIVHFVYGDGQIGATLIDQDIDFIVFTGSSNTGQKIYQKAAEKMIPVALELGGSSPGIVFEDCVVDEALIENLFWKRFSNTGQFCDSMKRLIVHNSLLDDVIEKLSKFSPKVILGDPLDPKTQLGPLVAERQVVRLEEQVKDALNKGAKLHCGGKRPENLKGAYYEPTVLSGITKDMAVWNEEVFGPVLPIVGFDTYEEAIELANDTEYGLTGSVFTKNKELARKAQLEIKAGLIDHNSCHFYRAQNPFGGYKKSGIGRQQGKAGFEEFTQVKVVAYEK